uniref:Uncharacterized protein n=1 Tax=Arundo donax TaxID=35708 RepID=A0A0A9G5F4_ARUDO
MCIFLQGCILFRRNITIVIRRYSVAKMWYGVILLLSNILVSKIHFTICSVSGQINKHAAYHIAERHVRDKRNSRKCDI